MSEWPVWSDVVAPLSAATALGGLVGLDREIRGRFAGLRTHILVAVGAAAFAVAGSAIATKTEGADVTRVIQGIAAGVGFIGAGAVLKLTDQAQVRGLTTASSIWLAAAVGTAAGIGLYMLAVCAAIVGVLTLTVLGQAEAYMEKKTQRVIREPMDKTETTARP